MKPLSVLHISSGDLIGSRFNGYDWHDDFQKQNIDSKMLVGWNHFSKENWVAGIQEHKNLASGRISNRVTHRQFLRAGMEDGNYRWSRNIFAHPWYKAADVIHLQIVHDGTLDLKSIERIIAEKPVVWTWHDPWPMTGHCIYPMDCGRWQKGCGQCPDLQRAFTIEHDRTSEMRLKKAKLAKLPYVLHVSTQWFADYIEKDKYSVTPVPEILKFGIAGVWQKAKDVQSLRRNMKIPEENFVIGLRAASEPQKNIEIVKNALRVLPEKTKLTVVTVQDSGYFKEFDKKFQIIEFPWTNNNDELVDFYSVLDLFVMPSTWETFGLMSLESMACGVPVVGLKGTAIDEVCNLEVHGYIIPENTGISLANVIETARNDQNLIASKGEIGANYVSKNFQISDFVADLRVLYLKAIKNYGAK